MSKFLDITAVICTYNSEKNIERCVDSLLENHVREIIVVDGGSLDKTVEKVKNKVDKVLYDSKMGLAIARNIGISAATSNYILNVGSDNYFPSNSIEQLLNYYRDNNFAGISMLTSVDYSNNKYLAFCMNVYRYTRFKPGITDVIGTPTLFNSSILKSNPYSKNVTHSDDEEICSRLNKLYGYKFAISNIVCKESNSDSISEVKDKWKRYGISDYEVYNRNKHTWNFLRKVISILHPVRVDLFIPLTRNIYGIATLPFLLYITFLRYYSWIQTVFYHRKYSIK